MHSMYLCSGTLSTESRFPTTATAIAPTQIYPLFETALRADAGRTVEEHQREVSELWATFAAVSAANPHAWSRVAYSPDEIRTPSADNRVVTFPYLKRMCANIDVDQGAAMLLRSVGAKEVVTDLLPRSH